MSNRDENFLSRWSRLKRGGGAAAKSAPSRGAADEGSPSPTAGDGAEPPQPDKEALDAAARHIEDVARINIEGLTYESDFRVFMEKGVPEELRNKALRKLWTTNPIFSETDGLDDYCEDFSDAVWAAPGLETAYKVGQGFMTDEEVAEWAALGRPPEVSASEADSESGMVSADNVAEDAGGTGDIQRGSAEPQPGTDAADIAQAAPEPGDTTEPEAPKT